MNYSEMSDFEINKAVALRLGLNIKPHRVDADDNPVFVIVGEKFTREKLPFEPCNSWADAGPIITDNKISVMYDENSWAAFSGMSIHHSRYADWDLLEYDKNPRRAAMIVFLMMQEQK